MKKMEKLLQKRVKMILKGEVIPATFDPVFKSLMMNCQEYLSSVLQGIIKDVTPIEKNRKRQVLCTY